MPMPDMHPATVQRPSTLERWRQEDAAELRRLGELAATQKIDIEYLRRALDGHERAMDDLLKALDTPSFAGVARATATWALDQSRIARGL